MSIDLFLKTTIRQFKARDFDAEHPTTLWLAEKYKWTREQRLWMCFLYMAFYDEASSWVVFHETDPFTVPKKLDYPIGMNRRNLFGGKIRDHFESLVQIKGGTEGWPLHNLRGKSLDWDLLKTNIRQVWGNGRFAQYTTAEMIQKVLKLPIEITGFDNRDSSGPAHGIHLVSGCDRDDIPALDREGEVIYQRVLGSRLSPGYVGVDRGVVESVLCNHSGICRGKFYCGRNLDRQQDRILKVEAQVGRTLKPLWEARQAVFNHDYLGELSGWVGVDRKRLLEYKTTGRLLWPDEDR